VEGQAAIEIERPRSVWQLIGATVDLFFRVPFLFLALAAIVVVPYELVMLLLTETGPFARGHTSIIVNQLGLLADYFLVIPLISALHVHAVREVGEGGRPRFVPTFRQSLPGLVTVGFATGISWVATTLGFLALVVPGILLLARWAVVAQTAALDGGRWIDPLRRSADLTERHRWHAFWLIVVAGIIAAVPSFALGLAFGHKTTTIASFAAGTAIEVVTRSFEALAAALLYFDLKSRQEIEAATPDDPKVPPTTVEGRAAGWYIDPSWPERMRYWAADGKGEWSKHTAKTPKAMLREWEEQDTDSHTGHSVDPGAYTDEDRPAGWYVDPDKPWRMRYWRKGEHEGWSKETTKTPPRVLENWRDLRWKR
jgi:hypothetical protein